MNIPLNNWKSIENHGILLTILVSGGRPELIRSSCFGTQSFSYVVGITQVEQALKNEFYSNALELNQWTYKKQLKYRSTEVKSSTFGSKIDEHPSTLLP